MARLTKDQKQQIIQMALNNSKPVQEFAKLIQETSPKIAAIVESFFPAATCKLENKRIKAKEELLNNNENFYHVKTYLPYTLEKNIQVQLPADCVLPSYSSYYFNASNRYSFHYNERALATYCSNDYFKNLLNLDITVYTPSRNLTFSDKSEVSKIILEFGNKYLELNKEFEEINSLVTSAINSVSTINKLLEAWPEAKDIIPQSVLDEQGTSGKSLVVPTFKLNKALGLPKT